MLENMGQPVRKEYLEEIGIYYNFEKNFLYLPVLHEEIHINNLTGSSVCRKSQITQTTYKREMTIVDVPPTSKYLSEVLRNTLPLQKESLCSLSNRWSDEITITAMDGITAITIDSGVIPSESREYIILFLQDVRSMKHHLW